MLHNDICLMTHRPVSCNLCLSNFQFVSSNQMPRKESSKTITMYLVDSLSLPSLGSVVDHRFLILIDCVGVFFAFS